MDPISFANELLRSKGLEATSCDIIQSLWAGYGTISRLHAVSTSSTAEPSKISLILKHVTPPLDTKSKRAEGDIRKLISYQVEQHFYSQLAPSMPANIAVADCIASSSEPSSSGTTMAMVLSDLRDKYPVACEKRGELDHTQVYAALNWLAGFHGFWWQRSHELRTKGLRLPPLEEAGNSYSEGPWLNGGYTYLSTRRSEYRSLQNDKGSEWAEKLCRPTLHSKSSIAELVADVLSPSASNSTLSPIRDYETLIHGDVKSENLFATSTGSAVAFFDFQYVGLGLGVCDLAKLFTCSVPAKLLGKEDGDLRAMSDGERTLLEYYQQMLQNSGQIYAWDILENHYNAALVDWLRFQASWGFWGNTQWLEARVRYILGDKEWTAWLLEAAAEAGHK